MSAQERRLRSELNKLLSRQGLLHGTLLRRKRVCGKPNCKCTRGELHESLYLVVTEGGESRQLYVPQPWGQTVQHWIDQYRQARGLMDDISRMHWEKLRRRQG
jgi:hypothetical protein